MPDLHDARAAINWYRTPVPRETLQALSRRSDGLGLLQAGGYLLLLVSSGAATLWSAFTGHIVLTVVLLFVYGTFATFNINAVHELCHNSVFKTRWLNGLFVRLFGFLGWNDWVWFNASHANHHRYTLHPPRDGEVVLPNAYAFLSRRNFVTTALWNFRAPFDMVKNALIRARGKWTDPWTLTLFPADQPEARRRLMNWNRFVLVGHGLIFAAAVVAAIITRRWAWLLVPYVVSFGTTCGNWLFYLCNNTQHVGLTDEVPDLRICCRSVRLPAFVSFLYWHMQYHTEHHMYAVVPCYNLRRLHKQIAADLPVPKGLIGTWREIGMILERQAREPAYQHVHTLPETAHPAVMGSRAAEIAAGAVPGDANADCDDLNLPAAATAGAQ